jgi:squalene-hopene/tetraprenyl-beta-curcumene cyclase
MSMSGAWSTRYTGTAKVLSHLNSLGTKELEYLRNGLKNGIEWLLNVQQDNGLWGGDADTPTTIEETALALDALAGLAQDKALDD